MTILDPQTSAKLAQFSRRQKRLLIGRAICVAAVSFVVIMSLIGLADWMWILSSTVRWVLSAVGYALVIGLVWYTALNRWFSPQDPASIARSFELAEPELRENLVSAVELSDESATTNGSPIFRELLQKKVASSIQWIDVRSLLPLKLIGRWLVAAIAVCCLFGIMLSLPGLSFRRLIARAALPGANLARVSLTKVEIIEPAPASRLVPRGETVAIVVEIAGPEVDGVTLESYSDSEGLNPQRMRPLGQRRYSANITVRDPQVDYRIMAGDAITEHHTLKSRARPRVEAFQKTYHYPDYAELADETITETDGNLVALEGSSVEVALKVDQAISEAKFLIETLGTDRILTIDAMPGEGGFYTATVPIRQSGIFKVHLKSEETGFENTFSPKYEIEPEPDLIPRVGFMNQQETTLLRPANDIVPLAALAEDDLPLVELRQLVSVNDGRWQTKPLEISSSPRVTKQWEMDLLKWKLTSGDTVSTKLVAIDRKGQRGESVPLKIVITSDEFDPDRHNSVEVRASVADRLAELSSSLLEASGTAVDIFKRARESNSRISAADQTLLANVASRLADESSDTLESVSTALEQLAGIDAYEVELVGQILSSMGQERSRNLRSIIGQLDAPGKKIEEVQKEYKKHEREFKIVGDDARWLDERFRDFFSHDLLGAVAIDLEGIWQQQKLLVDSGARFSPTRLRRQQKVSINYIHAIEDLMDEHADRIRRNSESQLDRLQGVVSSRREELQLALNNADDHSPLQRATERLYNDLNGYMNSSLVDGGLPNDIANSRRDLARRAGVIADRIDLANRSANELASEHKKRSAAKDTASAEAVDSTIKIKQAEFDFRLASARGQLSDFTELKQTRPDPNPQAVADAALAGKAMGHVFAKFDGALGQTETSEILQQMNTVRDAYRQLEAGHTILDFKPVAVDLLAAERWESQTYRSRIENPRIWDAIQRGVEIGSERARSARFSNESVDQINQLRWGGELNKGHEKLGMRRWDRKSVSAAAAAEELVRRLEATETMIAPTMTEARKKLEALLPTIDEVARELAEKAKELEKQTQEAAEEVIDRNEHEAQETARELEKKQEDLNAQVQQLLDDLAVEASTEDMMSEEGREQARDADDAIGMIEQPTEKALEELNEATEATVAVETAKELEQAATQQDQLAKALEQVANHFEKLEAGEDVTESREALRQAEQDLPNARELEQQYAKAERLANLAEQAESEQEALLRKLERELERNPEMQEALSDIATEAATQALNALDYAQKKEDSVRKTLENSDDNFKAEKRKMRQDLQEIASQAAATARTLAAQTNSVLQSAREPEAAEQAREAQQQLNDAANRARNVANDHLLEDMQAAATEVAQKLKEATEKFKQVKKEAEAASSEKLKDENAKKNLKRDMENIAKRMQEARVREEKNREKEADNYQRQMDTSVRNVEREVKNEENRVRQAEQQAHRDPKNDWHKQNVENSKARAEAAKRKLETEKSLREDAKGRRNEAAERRKKVEQEPRESLNAENPAAELAAKAAEKAIEETQALLDKAQQIATPAEFADQLAGNESSLEATRQIQESVGEDVQAASEDLARAARHEERLGKSPMGAEMLADAAERVADVAENQIATAEKQAEAAREASKAGNDKSEDGKPTPSAQASQAVQEASDAIGEQAQTIADMFAESQPAEQQNQEGVPSSEHQPASDQSANQQAKPSSQPSEPAASRSGEPTASQQASASTGQATPSSESEVQRGEKLARMLDDLDRAMNQASDDNAPGEQPTSPSMPSIEQMAAQQASQMNQSRQESRQESKEPAIPQESLLSGEGAELEQMSDQMLAAGQVDRTEGEWGKLRDQKAENAASGKRSEFSTLYRDQIEAYFKVIAERSRK